MPIVPEPPAMNTFMTSFPDAGGAPDADTARQRFSKREQRGRDAEDQVPRRLHAQDVIGALEVKMIDHAEHERSGHRRRDDPRASAPRGQARHRKSDEGPSHDDGDDEYV